MNIDGDTTWGSYRRGGPGIRGCHGLRRRGYYVGVICAEEGLLSGGHLDGALLDTKWVSYRRGILGLF